MIGPKELNTILLQLNNTLKELNERLNKLEADTIRNEKRLRRDIYKKIRDITS